jgi:hypothetical protein
MARRNFCNIPQAVSYRSIPNWRWSWTADTPGVWVVIRYAVQNQSVSGVRVRWSTVPAVTEVWPPQALHCQRSRRPSS